ncbi:MAG TPA: hypothetical protein VE869_10685 [Gemmatimonas sp.]|nr:hypothetical protein [Gemmatimonas sp.]
MTFSPWLRKAALTAHVTSSLGWFGAVAAFLALAVSGLQSADPLKVRSAYLAMDLTAWTVIVPLCIATLVTGIAQSLGTPWGIMRHYWVIAKIVLTVPASAILLLHMRPISYLAEVAAAGTLATGGEHRLRVQLIANAGAALFVLVVTTVLSIYKPRGLTPYGQRAMRRESAER